METTEILLRELGNATTEGEGSEVTRAGKGGTEEKTTTEEGEGEENGEPEEATEENVSTTDIEDDEGEEAGSEVH